MVEIAVMIGLATAVFFLLFIGWRMKIGAERAEKDKENTPKLLFSLSEIIIYCMAGIVVDVGLLVIFEMASALQYAPALRVTFLIFQIILGLVAGLGMVVFTIFLFIILFSFMFGKRNKTK